MNTNKYAVSIILPCYNVSQYIERAVDSILIQDFKDYGNHSIFRLDISC